MGSLVMSTFFVTGILAGIFGIMPAHLTTYEIETYILYVILFFVGASIGGNEKNKEILSRINLRIFLVPLAVAVGTFLGAACVARLIEGVTLRESIAVGAGFGYYSISSLIIGKMGNETLAVIALVSNVIREIFTILTAPLLVRFFGKLAPIASGGATSMDTTLPVVIRVCGAEYSAVSVVNGVILSLAVPVLIPLIFKIFP